MLNGNQFLVYEIPDEKIVLWGGTGHKNNYNAFWKQWDGTYGIPYYILELSDCLYSFGIDDDIHFEDAYSFHFDKPSYCFDGSCNCPLKISDEIVFVKKYLGTAEFSFAQNKESTIKNIISFNDLALNDNCKYILKMDIEGAEYKTLREFLNYKNKPIAIIVEFHHIKYYEKEFVEYITMINRDYICVYIHALDDILQIQVNDIKPTITDTIEFTFVRKDIAKEYKLSNNQKHPRPEERPSFHLFWEVLNYDK